MFKRSMRTLVLLSAAVIVAVGLSPGTARAASPEVVSSGAWVRMCTKTTLEGCGKVGTWTQGGTVSMKCWIDDSWATGRYSSNRWFYVTQGSKKGFVHSSHVENQVTVPNCSTHAGISASRWAAMQVGETRPSSTEAQGLGINDGMWSGWCAAFATGAYKYGVGRSPRFTGSARERYVKYSQAGLVRPWTGAEPLVGSMVFWPNVAQPFGHVAIAVGNGHVVSTQGLSDPTKKVARLPVTTWGTPAGWVAPADV